MIGRLAVTVALVGTVLAGCTAGQSDESESQDSSVRIAESLWADRTDYVGDNSKVAAILGDAGLGSAGDYTVALETRDRPYAATVTFTSLEKPFETTDFSHQATLLLGLVGNLEEVHVAGDGKTYSLTAAEATDALGYDVKNLGQDQERLKEYLEAESD